MQRREFIAVIGGVAGWPIAARAQQQAVPIIGFLNLGSFEARARDTTSFRAGLGETGYAEGQNVTIEYRWAEGQYDRLQMLAADLVQRRVAVIVTPGNGASVAAQAATNTIPIVFEVNNDPVKLGLVKNLAHPGGNATGVNFFNSELTGKRLGLLHELVPGNGLVAVLINPNNPLSDVVTREAEAGAAATGQKIEFFKATTTGEIETAFTMLVQRRAAALLVAPDGMFLTRHVQIVTLATRHAVPAIYQWREFAEAGGLMSYSASRRELFRQLGLYTGEILRGTKPADLPVMQPTKFELVINMTTARALGIEVPAQLLARADEVIE
jgi:putative ABC transport system substrate-binding protein